MLGVIQITTWIFWIHEIGKLNSKLNFYKLIPYLVDRCICLAPCWSRQTLEKKRPELGSGRDR